MPIELLGRRSLLIGASTFVATVSEGLLARPALSQEQGGRDSEIIQAIGRSVSLAEDILDSATEVPRPDLISREFQPEQANKEIARELSKALGDKKDSEQIDYARPEHVDLALKIREKDVPLIQSVDQIPELKVQINLGETQDNETIEDVLLDIFLEKFGLERKVRKAFKKVVSKLKLERILTQIANAVRERKLIRLSRLLRVFLSKLFGSEALKILEKSIGKRAMRKLLVRVGARFIPYLGWTLLAASCVYVVIDNSDRLTRAK